MLVGMMEEGTRLQEEIRKYQKNLDEAFGWSTLLQAPERLPGDTIYHIFFDVMAPRLQKWCSGRDNKVRLNVAMELAKTAVCLYVESAEKFLKNPEEATVQEVRGALGSYAAATAQFRIALSKWYAAYKHEERSRFFHVKYHLDQFFEETFQLTNA